MSNVVIPGKPSAERDISDAVVPSGLNTAPRKEFISASGRSREGSGWLKDDDGVATGDLDVCRGVVYGEYSFARWAVRCACEFGEISGG